MTNPPFGGRRGRGALGKTIVFGLWKRGDWVYTRIVPDVVERQVAKEAIVYTDSFALYDGVVDWGYRRHYRVNHGADESPESRQRD